MIVNKNIKDYTIKGKDLNDDDILKQDNLFGVYKFPT